MDNYAALPYVTLRAHLTWPEPPDLAVVWVVELALSRSPESVGLASDLFVLKRTQTTLLRALAVDAYEIKYSTQITQLNALHLDGLWYVTFVDFYTGIYRQ